MAEPKNNRQTFVDIEYSLNQYSDRYFAPIIESEYNRFWENKQKEAAPARKAIMEGMKYAPTQYVQVPKVVDGEWGRKNTEDLLTSCFQKFFGSQIHNQDLESMESAWREAMKQKIGEATYAELSKEVATGDLADYYFANRFKTLFVEKLGAMNAPKSSVDFIMTEGLRDTMLWKRSDKEFSTRPSEMDDQVVKESKKAYNPSVGEQVAAGAVTIGTDIALTGGFTSVGTAVSYAKWDLAIRAVMVGKEALFGDGSFDEQIGQIIWNDGDAIGDIRQSAKQVKLKESSIVKDIDKDLSKSIIAHPWDDALYHQNIGAVRGDYNYKTDKIGQILSDGFPSVLASQGLVIKKDTPIPKWMENKSEKEFFECSTSFIAMAFTMQELGITKKKVGDQVYTAQELAQKGYDYARALDLSQRRARGEDLSFFGKVKHQAERLKEMSHVGDSPGKQAVASEQVNKDSDFLTSKTDIDKSSPVHDDSVFVDHDEQIEKAPQPINTDSQIDQSGVRPFDEVPEQEAPKSVDGWGSLLDQLGLGGFGDVGKNLGYVIGMLPDMLIGMFTGKTRNLKFKDNLMPIASIVMGMFVRNPLLKMLLIGFGGANLLNKAGKEALENGRGQAQPVRQYRSYGDEPLDTRIKQPVMRGNTMIVTIDNIPNVITINEAAVDAYYKGQVPLNALANAVLRKYDEQQQVLHQSYDRQVTQEENLDVTRGIK